MCASKGGAARPATQGLSTRACIGSRAHSDLFYICTHVSCQPCFLKNWDVVFPSVQTGHQSSPRSSQMSVPPSFRKPLFFQPWHLGLCGAWFPCPCRGRLLSALSPQERAVEWRLPLHSAASWQHGGLPALVGPGADGPARHTF